MIINNTSVAYSRAGDKFHYRWAGRRCLELINFGTDLSCITIETSAERHLAGEDVVDLAEYRTQNGRNTVDYFQLKHSTVKVDSSFTISDLKDTFKGFSERFKEHMKTSTYVDFNFHIITNRKISTDFKKNIQQLAEGKCTNKSFSHTIKKYTSLDNNELKIFCSKIKLFDDEANYDGQKHQIYRELNSLSAIQDISTAEIKLVDKVWQKIEPHQSGVIKKEDILAVFDIVDVNDFFPVPPYFDSLATGYIPRTQQLDILNSITENLNPTIITAEGGIGKSTLSSQMSDLFYERNEHHVVVAYDCFGNGKYRQTSEKRHSVRNMVVQVVNQLATLYYCPQLIPTRNEPDEHWIRIFLTRIKEVCDKLRALNSEALLILVFDAVDNAMMASQEFSESCFANLLLRETVPNNCRLVFTTRPERVHLLDAPANINYIDLKGFSTEETLENLQHYYDGATLSQAEEFNKLTGCNPRVQANALALAPNYESIREFLLSFSANLTVESLIKDNLDAIKDKYPKAFRQSIDDICKSLANLPPFIPLSVIAKIANTTESEVASFVADLGRPLWLTDNAVQFRDEPTEKWFQDNYSGNAEQISNYVDIIKQIQPISSYLAEALPILLLKAERFEELVNLAISEEFLPNLSQYDNNRIKAIRLQYAFKASLKLKRYYEATKIAFVAGEEIASNERQLQLIKNNIDLACRFLSETRLKELAYRKIIQGNWQGVELVYSASILSQLPDNKGQAQNYLRSSQYWLEQYFEKRKKDKDNNSHYRQEKLENIDILELHSAIYHIFGYKHFIDSAKRWSPTQLRYSIFTNQIRKLIDNEDFETIEEMAKYGKKEALLILAICVEFQQVGKVFDSIPLSQCLNTLVAKKTRLDAPQEFQHLNTDYTSQVFLSFAEICLKAQLSPDKIKTLLSRYYYLPNRYFLSEREHHFDDVYNFLRFIAIQAYIAQEQTPDFEMFVKLCHTNQGEDDYKYQQELKGAIEIVSGLYPLFSLRLSAFIDPLRTFNKENIDTFQEYYRSNYRQGEYDPKAFITNQVKFETILFNQSPALIDLFYESIKPIKNKYFRIKYDDKFVFLRASYHHAKLHKLAEALEQDVVAQLDVFDEETSPETYSEECLKLCRAVLRFNADDAKVYYDKALDNNLKFGDETVARWEALSDIAKRGAEDQQPNPKLAHRYIRCAEMIGKSVSREKYWDRNDAIETCFQLSPNTAFANFNRWKERNVGWSNRQIIALANSALDFGEVLPTTLWALLSTFNWEYGYKDFLKNCLKKIDNKDIKKQMLDIYIANLRKEGICGSVWLEIEKIANEFQLVNSELNYIELLSKSYEPRRAVDLVNRSVERVNKQLETIEREWDTVYRGYDLLDAKDFTNAFLLYKARLESRIDEDFWTKCFAVIEHKNYLAFLEIIVNCNELEYYDLRQAFETIPESWKKRTSIIANWNKLIIKIASRFPQNITRTLGYDRDFAEPFLLNDNSLTAIQTGVELGFIDNPNVEDVISLFQFISFNVSKLTVTEAKKLTDFALLRFEKAIPHEYADGEWQESTNIPTTNTQALIQFIFANLGSPFTKERWRAVHAVIRMYKFKCQDELDYLLQLTSTNICKIYFPPKYEFYYRHAMLYLLVALYRASTESTELLIKHSDWLSEIATNHQNGILIQYYAQKICLTIEKEFMGSFEPEKLKQLHGLLESKFEPIYESSSFYHCDSDWYKQFEKKVLPKFHFPYDFDEYWFKPLGRVFGLSSGQVEQIAKDILFNEWKFKLKDTWIEDERSGLWQELNYYDNSYEMQGRHGSYPDIDTLSFYISYHLLLAVASKFILNLPIVQSQYDKQYSFLAWLDGHLLSYENAKLLADFRDFMPVKRQEWVYKSQSEHWKTELTDKNFIDNLITREADDFWLTLAGKWQEVDNERVEQFNYTAVVIPKAYSQAFLHTTINYQDDEKSCNIGNFCETFLDEDIVNCKNPVFQAYFLLNDHEHYRDIQSKDPYSGNIDFKSYHFANTVFEKMTKHGLVSQINEKVWLYDNVPALQNIHWSESPPKDKDKYYSYGCIAKVALDTLISICNLLDVEIAVQLSINRSYCDNYDKTRKYTYKPIYRTFILSADGKFRSTSQCYQLR